jgi:choline dehydrogenase-like flavoprotein
MEGRMNYGLSLNDFYVFNGAKLGNFHAHPLVMRSQITALLAQSVVLKHLPGRVLSQIAAAKFLGRSWTAFSAILEDLPYPENRVMPKAGSDEDIVYAYRYPSELRRRAQMMIEGFDHAAATAFDVRWLEPLRDINGSHACGTCRFGDNPLTSVLDRDNRAHDLDNLYVLDGSFFPSSGGINPSLTIVANSLRATDKIARRI